jgi:hypothetical protein
MRSIKAKRKLLFGCLAVLFNLLLVQNLNAQSGFTKIFDKTFGGNKADELFALEATTDGGFILGGSSYSDISGQKSQGCLGSTDFWIVKTDSAGNKQWDRTYGGNFVDNFRSLQQTKDGGYILGGSSSSGISGNKTWISYGGLDYWIVKLDAGGNKVWDRGFGGDSADILSVVQETSDGGFILAGGSNSLKSGSKSESNKGIKFDFWIVKVDKNGVKLWDKTIGGSDFDYLSGLRQTSDGGFLVCGESLSGIGGDKSEASRGASDFWVVKLDRNGNKLWDKTLGGPFSDFPSTVIESTDGSILIGGTSASRQGQDKSQDQKGMFDYWIVKLDKSGKKLWDKTFGGPIVSILAAFEQTRDSGFLLGGYSGEGANSDKAHLGYGQGDYWIIKTDGNGNMVWEKTIGGINSDILLTAHQTTDGGYLLGGYSDSRIGYDKSQPCQGGNDFWIIKFSAPCSELTANLKGSCENEITKVQAEISGFQPTNNGTPFWTLTYKINGTVNTVTGSVPTIILSPNAVLGTIFTLVSVVSGSCAANLNESFVVQDIPLPPTVVSGIRCNVGPITLLASGAPAGGNYNWYSSINNNLLVFKSENGTFITPDLEATTSYYVSVSNNAGCESTKEEVTAKVENCPLPIIPNIITINNDGQNDYFKPQYLPAGRWHLQIYSRWGTLIYEAKDYQNNWPEKKISDAIYYYLLRNSETGQQLKGWIEVRH